MSLKFNYKFAADNEIEINQDYDCFYYIHCNKLWNIDISGRSSFITFRGGIPYYKYPNIGAKINPAYVAWWGIINLNRYLKFKNRHNLERMHISTEWLKENYKENRDYIYWEYRFDWPNGKCLLKSPWVCGLAQALAASLFFRVAKIVNDQELFEIAQKALNIFNYRVEDGGLKTTLNGDDFYEEYPTEPSTCVLDGSLFIVLAFYDLYLATGEKKLFDSAFEGIVNNLDYWDYNNMWSYYGNFGYLSSIQYHLLNVTLLEVLFNLTNDNRIKQTIEVWKGYQDSFMKRIIILASYYYTNAMYTLLHKEELARFIKRKFKL